MLGNIGRNVGDTVGGSLYVRPFVSGSIEEIDGRRIEGLIVG